MAHRKLPAINSVACAVLWLIAGAVHSQSLTGTAHQMERRLDILNQELANQKQLLQQLEFMRQRFSDQSAQIESLERRVVQQQVALDTLRGTIGWDILAAQHGTGPAGASPLLAQAASPSPPQEAAPVGQAPDSQGRPPEVAPIFVQPGVLTQPGQYVLEPSLQYGYSSSNRVALLGYSYRLSPKSSLNVSVGAGLTRDTPDVSLTLRLPMTF